MEQRTGTDKPITELLNIPQRVSVSSEQPTEEQAELTDEEVKEAIEAARQKKAAKIRQQKYWEEVDRQRNYVHPKMDTATVYKAMVKNAERLGIEFKIDEHNRHIVKALCMYFGQDAEFEKLNESYSLRKGILLKGPVGCGKTTLMKLLAKNTYNSYKVISCRRAADEYAEFGHEVIMTYSRSIPVPSSDYFGQSEIGICFDDLGTEQDKKHFGNHVNVMADIILNRYDNHLLKGKTHITTNLSANQIDEEYGNRVRSRMREMFNIIEFDATASDRRA